jgi:hypothetical protein
VILGVCLSLSLAYPPRYRSLYKKSFANLDPSHVKRRQYFRQQDKNPPLKGQRISLGIRVEILQQVALVFIVPFFQQLVQYLDAERNILF